MSGVYVPIHIHSDLSLNDSCTKFEDYVELAVKAGMPAIATTEHDLPRSHISKWICCKRAGIKLLFGVEIYLTESLEMKVRDNYHAILIAKNKEGLEEMNNLMELASREDHHYFNNRLTFDEFLSISENVIKVSACLASPLSKLDPSHPRYLELANHYDYLEVQPHVYDKQAEYNKRLLDLSQKLGKPLVVGTDTHSSSPYKAMCRKIMMISKSKKAHQYDDEDKLDMTWKTYDELLDLFDRQGVLSRECVVEALANTVRLADSCEEIDFDTSIKYPILYGSREKDSEKFLERVERKFREKVDSGVISPCQVDEFRERMQEEIRVFKKLEMDGFMLSMAEFLEWCRENGIEPGPGRGSVGGSCIAYVTDITDVNPVQWKTVFSRFCNEDRKEIGDIDIDCIDDDRPKIFEYITQRFGWRYAARVGSYGTVSEDGSIDKIGCALRVIWDDKHPGAEKSENPWSLDVVKSIKEMFETDPDAARKKYPELFQYFDGVLGTRVSQSVHPAGIVVSPIDLSMEYGIFHKDGFYCLYIDMDELHEVGAAKYDFLVLKTLKVLKETCNLLGMKMPRMHEIDWNDEAVWKDIAKSPCGIFQMESAYAFKSMKKMQPKSIFELSLVTACIRPSGASYRDRLLARLPNKNPSKMIDDLLKDNFGYLIYQEDTIKFLQLICGLSGSEADNIRRAIGRKQKDRLERSLPDILNGYCDKSDKPRDEAEQEANEFLKIIEDSADYQFGYNHSIAYCMVSYLCAYMRYHYTVQFVTAFLNNAADSEDLANGADLCKLYGIKILPPRFGLSRSNYNCVSYKEIAKGIYSLSGFGTAVSETIFDASHSSKHDTFMDVLLDLVNERHVNRGQIETLIHIDFFSDFGNQRELDRILDMFYFFKCGSAKQIKKDRIDGSFIEDAVRSHSTGETKSGKAAASYRILDMNGLLQSCEIAVKAAKMNDYNPLTKFRFFRDAAGYEGFVSGLDKDRAILFVKEIYPVRRKSDGAQFGYNIVTKSLGSGIESRFTIKNATYNKEPIKKHDFIKCRRYEREGKYFNMTAYERLYEDIDDEY